MHDQCEGPQLLEIARLTLKENLASGALGTDKLPTLMAMNAIGIVERELDASAELVETEQLLLKAFNANSIGEICVAIRAGHFDHDAGVYDALLRSAELRARIYKPSPQ